MRYGRSPQVRLALVVITALAVAAASCGDDSDGATAATTTTTATEQPTTTTASGSSPDETTTTAGTTEAVVDFPVEVEMIGDIAYTSERTLDVYAPAEGSGWPVVVYFHGGPPAPGRRTDDATLLQALAAQGLVVYAPDWRSNGPAGGSQDSVCAIAFAEATAGDHGGDADAVTVSGYSTGGYTALVHGLLGADAPLEVTDCEVEANVTLPDAIAVGGAPVFAVEWARAGRLPLPAWTSLTPEELDLFDPYLLLGRNPDAIMALAVGDDDQGGLGAPPGGWPITDASLDYHQRLVEAGYEATLTTFPGGHDIEPGSEQEATFVEMIVDAATSAAAG